MKDPEQRAAFNLVKQAAKKVQLGTNTSTEELAVAYESFLKRLSASNPDAENVTVITFSGFEYKRRDLPRLIREGSTLAKVVINLWSAM